MHTDYMSEDRTKQLWLNHSAGAGRGVPAFIPCRVYETDAEYRA